MGSGGRNRKHWATTADAFSVDANTLRKAGVLVPGWSGGWQWTRDGERVADVRITTTDTGLSLAYRTRTGNEPWRDMSETVAVIWSACRFGGQRPFLICPCCGRRAVKLRLLGKVACRACHRLPYHSQRLGPLDRALRRANMIRVRLGGEPGMAWPIPPKPKGMRWATYDRLRHEVIQAELVADAMLETQYERLFAFRPSSTL
jgi:hypothetical protein